MDKTGSFSQKARVSRSTGAETVNKSSDAANIRQKINVSDDHYHAKKLGLGSHGKHEGWTKAEEAGLSSKPETHADIRHELIAVAAYYLAEKRGFEGDNAIEDWVKAEAEIEAMLFP